MPRFRRTQENWNKLIEAFREKPGNAAYAGRYAGCDYRVAQTAYEKGWSNRKEFTENKSIRAILLEEKMEVRAKIRDMEAEKVSEAQRARELRQKAKEDAVIDKAQEVQAARAAFGNAVRGLAMAGKLGEKIKKVTERCGHLIDKDVDGMDLWEVVNFMKSYAWINDRANALARDALELSRKVGGEPDQVIQMVGGVEHTLKPDALLEAFGGDEKLLSQAIIDVAQGKTHTEPAQLLLDAKAREMDENLH